MDPIAHRALTMLRELRSVTFATVEDNLPQARIADVMAYENGRLLCSVCKGKPFHRQLLDTGKVALVGMTPDYVMIRLLGDVEFVADEHRSRIFELNPDLANLFPNKEGQAQLAPYFIIRGKGEIFDLSGKQGKMRRERFAFGGATVNPAGYSINEDCIACGACKDVCPFDAVSAGEQQYSIAPERCDECGACFAACPAGAIDPPNGL